MTAIEERIRYYRDRNVRERIREFIGAAGRSEPSCEFLTASGADTVSFELHPGSAINRLLDGGFEICRSLWDRKALIADFDIEYVNFDNPTEAFVNPERIFAIQQPVEEIIARLLREYGIVALHNLSGRGHHFVWRIDQSSPEFRKLAEIGRGPPSLWQTESDRHPPNIRPVPMDLARAFAGLGLVMEFLAHRVKRTAAPVTRIPVELTAIEVGPSKHGREMISIDISEYGDPLYSRMLRVPFSAYLKPWQQWWAFNPGLLDDLPPVFVIPLQGIDWREGIATMRDPACAAKLAANSATTIPDSSQGTGNLLADYQRSKLAKDHAWFYSQEQHPEDIWPDTYDREPMEILPACVRMTLENPNDLLLRPAHIRRVVRVMLALGWHPRHIAGLISSKYRRDFGWTQFNDVDPATRADFYTRVFTGLFTDGTEDLADFNCVSAQEQGTCSLSDCEMDLRDFRDSALERRAHDKLAHRPFNRLLLPSKHS